MTSGLKVLLLRGWDLSCRDRIYQKSVNEHIHVLFHWHKIDLLDYSRLQKSAEAVICQMFSLSVTTLAFMVVAEYFPISNAGSVTKAIADITSDDTLLVRASPIFSGAASEDLSPTPRGVVPFLSALLDEAISSAANAAAVDAATEPTGVNVASESVRISGAFFLIL